MTIGCAIFTCSMIVLAAAPIASSPGGRVPLMWPILFHLISNVGWLFFTPVVTAFYAEKAPTELRGTILGINGVAIFTASIVSGRLGGLYETVTPTHFWLIHAAIVGSGAVSLLFLGSPLRRFLADPHTAAATFIS